MAHLVNTSYLTTAPAVTVNKMTYLEPDAKKKNRALIVNSGPVNLSGEDNKDFDEKNGINVKLNLIWLLN